ARAPGPPGPPRPGPPPAPRGGAGPRARAAAGPPAGGGRPAGGGPPPPAAAAAASGLARIRRRPPRSSSAEGAREQLLHVLPGATISLGVVAERDAELLPVGVRFGVREAVARAGIGDEAVVGARRVHLLLEGRHVGVGHEPVRRAVTDEDLRL